MGAIDNVIKAEVSRLARREMRKLVGPLREELKRLKKRDAGLKAKVDGLEREILKIRAKERLTETASKASAGAVQGRLSPRLIRSLRRKLGLSQVAFARLLGVSSLTIGQWERGKTNPRPEMRAKILSFRGMGRREVKTIVANLFETASTVKVSSAAKAARPAPVIKKKAAMKRRRSAPKKSRRRKS